MLKYIINKQLYEEIILKRVPFTKRFLWISTADLKDMYVHKKNQMVPFLEILSDLIDNGILVRLLHSKEPGKNFRDDFDKYPSLIEGLERMLCPRVHFKVIVIDGVFAYSGSANITGAGMGSKSVDKRNFEAGFITDEKKFVRQIMQQFDDIWIGKFCHSCKRRDFCTDAIIS